MEDDSEVVGLLDLIDQTTATTQHDLRGFQHCDPPEDEYYHISHEFNAGGAVEPEWNCYNYTQQEPERSQFCL